MLKRLFPHMYDSPENGQAVGGLTFGVIPFILMPFTLTMLVWDTAAIAPRVVLECIYLIINFIFLFAIFRTYLQDSWLNVTVYPKRFWPVCLWAAGMIAALYGGVTYAAIEGLFDKAEITALGILPMEGVELMLLPGDFVLSGGIPALAIAIILGPVITACMFYAPVFSPLCVSGHRFLAYLAVAVLTAVPRFITWFTIWGGWKEKELFLFQLPIHWLACWTYQKTDTIWAPIFTHAIANVLCCGLLYGLQLMGYIT